MNAVLYVDSGLSLAILFIRYIPLPPQSFFRHKLIMEISWLEFLGHL